MVVLPRSGLQILRQSVEAALPALLMPLANAHPGNAFMGHDDFGGRALRREPNRHTLGCAGERLESPGIDQLVGCFDDFEFPGDPQNFSVRKAVADAVTAADQPWGDRPRQNILLFIGRRLDRAKLNEGFQACLV